MKKAYVVLGVLVFAFAVAYVGIQAKANDQLESVKSFNAEQGQLPEGLTIDKTGNIYVSLGPPFFVGGGYGAVWKLSPDGTEAASLIEYPEGPSPAGIVVNPSGKVYFALVADPASNDGSIGGVYSLTSDGDAERLPGTDGIIVPNGLALDKHGALFVSDSITGNIWRISPSGSTPAEVWLEHDLLAGCPNDFGSNGIAFWKSNLYVANTSKGTLVRIPILMDGSPGEPTIVAGDPDCEPAGLFGMDGIALDVHGNVYALLVLQNKLVRIDPTDGTYTVLLTEEDGLWNPASIAFGTGKGNRESIYITNYAVIPPGSDIFGPAVLKYDVGIPGLPLP